MEISQLKYKNFIPKNAMQIVRKQTVLKRKIMPETKDKTKKTKLTQNLTPLNLMNRLKIQSGANNNHPRLTDEIDTIPKILFGQNYRISDEENKKETKKENMKDDDWIKGGGNQMANPKMEKMKDEDNAEPEGDRNGNSKTEKMSEKLNYFPKVLKRMSLGPDLSKKLRDAKTERKRRSLSIERDDATRDGYKSPPPTKHCEWKRPPAKFQPWTPGSVRKTYAEGMMSRETPPMKCLSPERKKASPKRRFEGKQILFENDKSYCSDLKSYSFLELIGTGSSFNVYKVRCSKSKQLFALKKSQAKITSDSKFQHFKREIKAINQIGPHPNIIPLLAGWMEFSDIFYLTPLHHFTLKDWPGADDLDLAAIKASALEKGVWKMLSDISGALEHISAKGYVHVDVKPANILVNRPSYRGVLASASEGAARLSEDEFVLTDFGQARRKPGAVADEWPSDLGEWRYRPPEILARTSSLRHDGEVVGAVSSDYDVYSLGLVTLDILLGTILPHTALERIREGFVMDFLEGTKWSCKLKKLVASMLSKEAEKRPLAGQIKEEGDRVLGVENASFENF